MIVKNAVQGVLSILKASGRSETTIKDSYRVFYNPLLAKHATDVLCRDMLGRCSQEKYGKDVLDVTTWPLSLKERGCRLAYTRLLDYAGGATEIVTHIWSESAPIGDLEATALEAYRAFRCTAGDCEITRDQKIGILRRFLATNPFCELDDERIHVYRKAFLERNCGVYTMKREMEEVKKFLDFACVQGYIKENCSAAFPSIKAVQEDRAPSIYSGDEIRQFLDHMEHQTGEHAKRNYAIAVLISTYGIRANDIARMKAEAIDFERGLISFSQSKTGTEAVLDLTAHAGKAVAAYVLDERPPAECDRLFLKSDGAALSNKTVGCIIHDGIVASGIDLNGRKSGPHSLRFSRATALINEGHSVFAIAQVLGHTAAATTRRYAQVDMAHLSMCALEVPHE